MKNEVYKIRIVADTEEDIFADVYVEKNTPFISLHQFITEAFKLNNMEMASFYLSNDQWDKGEEITLFPMQIDDEQTNSKSMEETTLNEIFNQGIQKILYLHDFLNMNIFYIEIIESKQLDNKVEGVELIHQFGQYQAKKTIIEENEATNEASAIDEIYKEFNEDIIGDDFEELDEDLY
tara:strand:+ start:570 stop:1106 length:537 start_codon:yes stop_codon:yes gene_type:complete